MITDWRSKFDLPDLSFFFVQLAPVSPATISPVISRVRSSDAYRCCQQYFQRRDFTAVRNAQMAALKLPNTGYAVAIDLGDIHSPVTPIHPRRKQEVGRRLALSALSVQYGQSVVSTGPVFASITATAGTATVSYKPGTASGLHHAGTADCDQIGSRLCCGESPFAVLLANSTWERAEYRIQAEQVVLTLPADAARPLATRYAWEAWPQCSLYNGAGGPDNHTGIAATPWCWNRTAPCPY